MKVVRVCHAGRDAAHRERERALVRAGVDLTLVVPESWPGADDLGPEPFDVVQVPVRRPGDVNRHRLADPAAIGALVARLRPDVVDLHEEPFSSVVHQLLGVLPAGQTVVSYAAQNIDKRFPPPFAQWERRALGRIQGLYPCSRQAASVAVGKGFRGAVRVLPLAPPPEVTPGAQPPPIDSLALLLVGRLVAEKGVLDAVRVLAAARPRIAATLDIVGAGPEAAAAQALATDLGVADALTLHPWLDAAGLAERYRAAHVLLAPSRATRTWVEQFGRMVVEAHAAGAVVVGYASGSLPEVVGSAGVLVPEGDEAALAESVLALVRDPARWKALRAAGLSAARTCSWDAVAAGQLALYDEARGHRPATAARPQRAVAVARWGEPAQIAGGGRPFALPVLRRQTAGTRALARAVDGLARRDRSLAPGRLRVVYLDHVARMSGGELALLRLVEAMPDVEAHVILGEDGPLRAALVEAGATVEILELDSATRDVRRGDVGARLGTVRAAASTAGYTVRLARRLRELRPDLVHTNSLKSGYYGSVAARLAGVPVIWHVRDRIADDYLPPRAVALTRTMLRVLPTTVICNSAETLRTVGGGVADRSCVVHDPYAPRGAGPRERRGDVIGIVGRLAEWKGQDVFVRALAAVCADYPDLRGRVVGSAMFDEHAYADTLRALAQELGVADRVTFVGFVDAVEEELAGLDVLVHASVIPEPFGQVVVEGMAAGLPVIASAAGGPAEIITDGVDGLLVAPGDVQALASAMRRLVGDGDLRARLGAAAVDRAADFAPDRIGPQMRACYDGLLAARRRRTTVTES
jgi:glycosyltransferase involved in cell wall biosynthesis